MLSVFLRYLRGYLHIKIIGYSPERFLNLCRHHGIYLWGLSPSNDVSPGGVSPGGAYEMKISVSHYRRLKPILKKTNTKVLILERCGPAFFLHRYRKRKVFFFGIFLCLSLIWILSRHVWSIEVEGNHKWTDAVLVEFLESKNICHGMKLSNINCEQIVKDIRKEYNDIIWVSASVKGTRLVIDIKENSDTYTALETTGSEPMDIVSQVDGTITKIITRKGTPLVHTGDWITKGQLLVNGQIPVKNDSGEITGYHYMKADADIYVRTQQTYERQMERTYQEKIYSGIQKKLYFLDVGSYRFAFGSLHHQYKEYTSFLEMYPFRIHSNFELPISAGFETIRHYESKETQYTQKELQEILSNDFQRYCENLEKKGVEIIQNNVKIHIGDHTAEATGTLELLEPTGELVPLSIAPPEEPAEEPAPDDSHQ